MSSNLLVKAENLAINIGGNSLLTNVSFNLHEGEKIALVGRNGSGKSTLLKTLNNDFELDNGQIQIQKGITLGLLPQNVEVKGYKTLYDYGIKDLEEDEAYLYQIAAHHLDLDPSIETSKASGGELRKASLARLFAKTKDLYLMDEPTNHLDIQSILWLETEINKSKKAFLIISHDRKLLANISTKTFWLDRGKLRICPFGFAQFEDWQEEFIIQENAQRHKLDRKIKSETMWSIEGISGRRKRNQGRVRALQTLKEKRAQMIKRETSFAVTTTQPKVDSQLILEVSEINKKLGEKIICSDFSLRVMKGDRIAIIGPNGAGKTTLLKCLTQTIPVDKGKVRLGFNLNFAAMWQDREKANPKISLQQFLVGKGANARDNPDHVIFQGRSQHVISYIKKFQFPYWQAKVPLQSLSGGEFGRLLLAKILLKESNFLALDEPTNDLDVETLDMLQDILADYQGTVLFVSHDRDFIDKVAGTTINWESEGHWKVYAGGWTDYQKQKTKTSAYSHVKSSQKGTPLEVNINDQDKNIKLSFTELHRLEALPNLIERKVNEIESLNQQLLDLELYERRPKEFELLTQKLASEEEEIQSLEEEWYLLAQKSEEKNN